MRMLDCSRPWNSLIVKLFGWTGQIACRAVPPVPPPVLFKAVFDHAENHSQYKGCCLVNTSWGLFASVYDNKSRKNSELYLNWIQRYKGSQETIGQGAEYNRKVYFPVENGKGLCYDGSSVREVCSLRHASAMLNYKGQPCFVSSEDDGEYLINADNGSKVLKLNVAAKIGIPTAAAQFPNSDEWLIALADGPGVLATTDGRSVSCPGVSQVENWNGRMVGAAGGSVFEIDPFTLAQTRILDIGCKVIPHLWYDAANKLLWVSSSCPDKLLYLDASGKTTIVMECPTEGEGKLFDCRVTTGWWYRANGTRAEWYRLEKAGDPTPQPQPDPALPVPVKLAHSGPEELPSAFECKENESLDKEAFGIGDTRFLSVTRDRFIRSSMAKPHVREVAGFIVADDFEKVLNGVRYIFAAVKFMSGTSENVSTDNPVPRSWCKKTFRVWWRCYKKEKQQ